MLLPVNIRSWSAWAPGVSSRADWEEWAAGGRAIESSDAVPPLEHLPVLFKRRLSQISRMALHVGHELCPGPREMKAVFASRYGEIGHQVKLTASLLDSGEISPAVFSYSVFNAPVALLSISEKNPDRATALSAGPASFQSAILEAAAMQQREEDEEVMIIAADERVPPPFSDLAPASHVPHALGLVLTRRPGPEAIRIQIVLDPRPSAVPATETTPSALCFLRWVLGDRHQPLTLSHQGCTLMFRQA